MKTPDEKTLVSALKKGDRTAFEEIFRIYNEKVYAFCYSVLRQSEEAENITQDTFIKLWMVRETIDMEKSFSGFLFTIARNMVFYHSRSEINRQLILHDVIKQKSQDPNPTESRVLFNELEHSLAKIINKLPSKRKEIFLLSREKGLSHAEISKRLNISVYTVDSQMSKALKFIRKSLAHYFFTAVFFTMLFL